MNTPNQTELVIRDLAVIATKMLEVQEFEGVDLAEQERRAVDLTIENAIDDQSFDTPASELAVVADRQYDVSVPDEQPESWAEALPVIRDSVLAHREANRGVHPDPTEHPDSYGIQV